SLPHAAEHVVQYRLVESVLVFEVVIKERFVHSRGLRDAVGTGAGNAVLGEFRHGGAKNCGPAFFRLPARPEACWAPAATVRGAMFDTRFFRLRALCQAPGASPCRSRAPRLFRVCR